MILKLILGVIFSISLLTVSQAESLSQFTSVKHEDCIIKSMADENSEIDFYDAVCPSFAGYDLSISGGDIRYNLKLSFNGVEIPTENAGGAFHDMGSDKVEWRYSVKPGKSLWDTKIEYSAIIYKISYSKYSEEGLPESDEITVVIKLDGEKSCQTGRILTSEADGDISKMARAIADNPNTACLKK